MPVLHRCSARRPSPGGGVDLVLPQRFRFSVFPCCIRSRNSASASAVFHITPAVRSAKIPCGTQPPTNCETHAEKASVTKPAPWNGLSLARDDQFSRINHHEVNAPDLLFRSSRRPDQSRVQISRCWNNDQLATNLHLPTIQRFHRPLLTDTLVCTSPPGHRIQSISTLVLAGTEQSDFRSLPDDFRLRIIVPGSLLFVRLVLERDDSLNNHPSQVQDESG
jgi:hypothetical protein